MKSRHLWAAGTAAILSIFASALGQPSSPVSSSELALRLKKLTVLGSALYVAAHPDDENTTLISYLAKGRLLRTGYLSMTRGEGGQNLIGSEQGELLGIVRTQELLAARRVDGGEQFFTRAIDFGYSKTSEETIRIWNREKIVSDIVWVIRKFRPDVVINRFSDTLGGHGNHLASAILTREAFQAAGEASRFPEQLNYVKPWRPKRLVFNVFRFGGTGLDPSAKATKADVGTYSPLLGLSFNEISGMSRSMHKTQGFGAGQNRGSAFQYFEPIEGDQAGNDLLDGVDLSWSRVPGSEVVAGLLQKAVNSFEPEDPSKILPILMDAFDAMRNISANPWVELKREELVQVILGCAGIWFEALASDYSAPPGGQLRITALALNRSAVPVTLEDVDVTYQQKDTVLHQNLANNVLFQTPLGVKIPETASYTQPYWLKAPSEQGTYRVSNQEAIGCPGDSAALSAVFTFSILDRAIRVSVPVRFRWIDPVEGEQYRPCAIVSAVSVSLARQVFFYPDTKEKEVRVLLQCGGNPRAGAVRLLLPDGWNSSPESIPFALRKKGDEVAVVFSVWPGEKGRDGEFRAVARSDGEEFSSGMTQISYRHIPIQMLFPEAVGKLVRLDVRKKGSRIAYIAGSGDEVPAALSQVGYSIRLLSDEELEFGNLQGYDAIVAGVRAYNTRPKLKVHQERFMEYVEKGGTYVVQYVTQQRLESENLGPYPFEVSRDRVSVEEAPVTFNDPNHPILNSPNKIGPSDFEGWVQERGLYFAGKWDSRYQTVLQCNDPGEPPRAGGLLVAKYGKGYYIYTGYSFFRQLPAGVPGAYKLFVNLISAGK